MRNISFMLTTRQVRDRSKDVTRRLNWLTVKPGDRLQGCEKCQGRKAGEPLVKLCVIEVVSVRRERLDVLLADPYGGAKHTKSERRFTDYAMDEMRREGFPPDDPAGIYHDVLRVAREVHTADRSHPHRIQIPMSHVVDKQIGEAESKLVLLIREVKTDNPAVFERVQAWVKRMTGREKLSEYLHDDKVPAKDRVTVARSLVDILLQKQFDRLPELAETPPEPRPTLQTPAPASPPQPAPPAASPESEQEMPAPDELRAMIRKEVRLEFADLLERIAKVLRE